jgi:hypothetical protein
MPPLNNLDRLDLSTNGDSLGKPFMYSFMNTNFRRGKGYYQNTIGFWSKFF